MLSIAASELLAELSGYHKTIEHKKPSVVTV